MEMMFVGEKWAQTSSRLGSASCSLQRMPKSFISRKGNRNLICRVVTAGDSTVAIQGQSLSISQTFASLRSRGKVALIPYITAGDPDLFTTAKALKILDSCGADIIELGVPYSDPLADGPVIQAAATRALQNGTNFDAVISMLREVIPHLASPLVLFTYYNPILKHGLENFMHIISSIGIRGLVVPDVPLEETQALRDICATNEIELVLLTTPTTPTERMRKIVDASEGFVYLVSITGVTGARASVASRVEFLLHDIKQDNGCTQIIASTVLDVHPDRIRRVHLYCIISGPGSYLQDAIMVTTKPVAVGFGISKPEHVAQIAGWGADGVIVGSAMVKLLAEANSPEEGLKQLETLARNLKAALP